MSQIHTDRKVKNLMQLRQNESSVTVGKQLSGLNLREVVTKVWLNEVVLTTSRRLFADTH